MLWKYENKNLLTNKDIKFIINNFLLDFQFSTDLDSI